MLADEELDCMLELLPVAEPDCPEVLDELPEAAFGESLEDGLLVLWLWLALESGEAVEDCPLALPAVLGEEDVEDCPLMLPEVLGEDDVDDCPLMLPLAEEPVDDCPLALPVWVPAPELWLLVGDAVVSFAGA